MRKGLTVLGSVALVLVIAGGGWAGQTLITGRDVRDRSLGTRDLGTGAVKPRVLAARAVTTAKLRDGAVTTAKLRDGAVTASKLAVGSLSAAALADGSVEGRKLAVGTVDGSRLAFGAVGTDQIENGAVESDDIAVDAVGSVEIFNNSVGSVDIANFTIASVDMAANAVTDTKIAAGAVGTAKLAGDAVTREKIAAALLAALGGLEHDYGGTAAATSVEKVVGRVRYAGRVAVVTYTPEASIAGQATNTRRLELVNRGQSGAGTAVIAAIEFGPGVAATAFDELALAIHAPSDAVAEGDILTLRSTAIGTGLASPPGLLRVEVARS